MEKARKLALRPASAPRSGDIVLGTLVEISGAGEPVVEVWGVPRRISATTLVQFDTEITSADQLLGRSVLVQVTGTKPWELVILGFPSESIWRRREESPSGRRQARDAEINARSIKLAAESEIELICGSSAIVLRSDGSVVVRGENVTSRAKKMNKIRGAAVNIN